MAYYKTIQFTFVLTFLIVSFLQVKSDSSMFKDNISQSPPAVNCQISNLSSDNSTPLATILEPIAEPEPNGISVTSRNNTDTLKEKNEKPMAENSTIGTIPKPTTMSTTTMPPTTTTTAKPATSTTISTITMSNLTTKSTTIMPIITKSSNVTLDTNPMVSGCTNDTTHHTEYSSITANKTEISNPIKLHNPEGKSINISSDNSTHNANSSQLIAEPKPKGINDTSRNNSDTVTEENEKPTAQNDTIVTKSNLTTTSTTTMSLTTITTAQPTTSTTTSKTTMLALITKSTTTMPNITKSSNVTLDTNPIVSGIINHTTQHTEDSSVTPNKTEISNLVKLDNREGKSINFNKTTAGNGNGTMGGTTGILNKTMEIDSPSEKLTMAVNEILVEKKNSTMNESLGVGKTNHTLNVTINGNITANAMPATTVSSPENNDACKSTQIYIQTIFTSFIVLKVFYA